MAKNRKTTGSKKFIATLPYLVAPNDVQIDQMEVNFYLNQAFQQSRFYPFDFDFDEEDRFLAWMMEIEDNKFDRMTDDYLCLAMERSRRELNTHEAKLFHKLERVQDHFSGDFLYYGDDCWDMHSEDPDYDPRDDDLFFDFMGMDSYPGPVYSYEDFVGDWENEKRELHFCPEQALVREIPLRGLKHQARQALIREYCVI